VLLVSERSRFAALSASEHTLVFVGGLHRSGTSAVYRLLGSDPRVSVFSETGAIEDEGQFLQTVYEPDTSHGGPGLFGLDPAAHLTENSPLVADAQRRLFAEWSRYWDLTRPVLAEKSPANLIRGRFLQAIFPGARFLFITRHPVAAAMATAKWTGAYATTLLKHWIRCHELMTADLPHLEHVLVVRYEDLTDNPRSFKVPFERLLGLDGLDLAWELLRPGLNARYFAQWRRGDFHLKGRRRDRLKRWRNLWEVRCLERRLADAVAQFGYGFEEVRSN